jgi:hypothetical protein
MPISLIETASLDAGLVAPSATTATTATTATSLTTASGSAPSYSARAWVNFDGTGTPAIRASGNVSSITDNGTGDYTVNFTNAMPDANYAYEFSGGAAVSSGSMLYQGSTQTTSSIRYLLSGPPGSAQDAATQCVAIFR